MTTEMNSRKICFFSGDITRCGGTEKISILLANALAAEPETEVCFLSWYEKAADPYFEMDPRVKRYRLFHFNLPFRFFYGFAAKKLKSFLQKNGITHLIDIDTILTNVSAPAVAGTGCKLIAWEHFHYHENLGCKLRDRGRKKAKKYADAIVVLTDDDQKQYLETPSSARIVTIPNMVLPPVETENANLPEKPFILSVGRLCYQKGFDRIPAIAEKIFAGNDHWKWIIAGDGEDCKKLKSEISARNLSNKIFLIGKCDPAPLFRHAAFTVMTSRFEGFPLVLLESLQQRCPVVAFACKNGPAEIIRDGENGFLIPDGDLGSMAEKIRILMNDDALRERFSQAAPDSIRSFSPEIFLERWKNLFAELEKKP